MGVKFNNINDISLTTVFSLAKDSRTGEWGVKVQETYARAVKRGVDVKIGNQVRGKNWEDGVASTLTIIFNATELETEIARLQKASFRSAAGHEKARAALENFQKDPAEQGHEILRQTTTFKKAGRVFAEKKAAIRTVEKDAAGVETSSEKILTKEALEKHMREIEYNSNLPDDNYKTFYWNALKKMRKSSF